MITKNLKLLLLFSINLILFSNFIYSQTKYEDLINEYENYYNLYENFAYNIEETDKENNMADIINNFVDKMYIISDKILNIKAKYPELDKINEYPEDLNNILIKINKLLKSNRLKNIQEKTYKFKSKSQNMEKAIIRLESLKKR